MKKRILSTLLMAIIGIPILLKGEIYFNILITIIGILGVREINKLIGKEKIVVLDIIRYLSIAFLINIHFLNISVVNYSLLVFLLYTFFSIFYISKKKLKIEDSVLSIFLTFLVGFSLMNINFLREDRLAPLIFLLSLAIISDTFSYIIGSLIGKHKLTNISPKKTWEGLLGGIISSIIINTSFYHAALNNNLNIFLVILLVLFLTLIGQVGDLFFSSIKRGYKVKDYSELIPGHGGVLDRIDSLTFIILGYMLILGFM